MDKDVGEKAREKLAELKRKVKENKNEIKETINEVGKGLFGLGGMAAIAFLTYAWGMNDVFIPREKMEAVPEKKAKEIRLSYDEALLHNIDSLTNEGEPVKKAVGDAHAITWKEASECMPKDQGDYSGEDWIKYREAHKQFNASRRKTRKRGLKLGYHYFREDYPQILESEIKEKKAELIGMQSAENTQTRAVTESLTR